MDSCKIPYAFESSECRNILVFHLVAYSPTNMHACLTGPAFPDPIVMVGSTKINLSRGCLVVQKLKDILHQTKETEHAVAMGPLDGGATETLSLFVSLR